MTTARRPFLIHQCLPPLSATAGLTSIHPTLSAPGILNTSPSHCTRDLPGFEEQATRNESTIKFWRQVQAARRRGFPRMPEWGGATGMLKEQLSGGRSISALLSTWTEWGDGIHQVGLLASAQHPLILCDSFLLWHFSCFEFFLPAWPNVPTVWTRPQDDCVWKTGDKEKQTTSSVNSQLYGSFRSLVSRRVPEHYYTPAPEQCVVHSKHQISICWVNEMTAVTALPNAHGEWLYVMLGRRSCRV